LRDNHARLAVRKSDSNSVEWNSCYRYIKQHNSFYSQPVYGDFQSCSLLSLNYSVQLRLPTYHDILALPAFARRCCSNRWISPAGRAHSSKPVAAGLLLWAHAGTNGRTDTVPFHRPRFAYYAGSANTLEELWIDRLQAAIIWCYRWPQTTELALFAKYCFFPTKHIISDYPVVVIYHYHSWSSSRDSHRCHYPLVECCTIHHRNFT